MSVRMLREHTSRLYIMKKSRHMERNLCTLRCTHIYTLKYTLHIKYTQNHSLLHKK